MTNDVELRLRHIELIQEVINRHAQNSFIVRGWSVTLVSAVFAVLVTQGGTARGLVLLAIAPTLIFWGLDAYFLWKERQFRRLFAAVARRLRDGDAAPDVPLFEMNTHPYRDHRGRMWRTLYVPAVAAVPVVLIVTVLTYWIARR
ncbi:MAG: hypothetical protein AUI14_03125 [Actinobacteria bacterium 13_2_20CM_2_71_6]|nr:MAG: hypothetical protein AUI14_03125 [Actinobacteria bacterium 13_2_20CM_2_71_6]